MRTDYEKKKKDSVNAEFLINGIIALFGVVLVILGIFATSFGTEVDTVLVSVGASLIASAIVAYLSSIYIQKYRRAKEISEIWGIYSIEDKRATMNIKIDKQMEKANRHYDLIAFGLKSLREGNTPGVKNCLKRGASIRIISVDPDCELLKMRDRQEGKIEGSTAHSIRQLQIWADELNQKYPGKITVKYSKYLPNEFYCRVDDSIFVGPYQFGKESQQTITSEYRNPGKAFALYEAYFDDLWKNAEYYN